MKSKHVYNVKGNMWCEGTLLWAKRDLLRYPRCPSVTTANYYKISKTITQEQRRMQQLSLRFGKTFMIFIYLI